MIYQMKTDKKLPNIHIGAKRTTITINDKDVTLCPEVWAVHSEQFGGYDYGHNKTNAAWNVSKVSGNAVFMWAIDGIGRPRNQAVTIEEFFRDYYKVVR